MPEMKTKKEILDHLAELMERRRTQLNYKLRYMDELKEANGRLKTAQDSVNMYTSYVNRAINEIKKIEAEIEAVSPAIYIPAPLPPELEGRVFRSEE